MNVFRCLFFAAASALVAGVIVTARWPLSMTPTAPVPMDNVTVYAFSQSNPGDNDPQVLQLAPDIVIRAWQRSNRDGLRASDYDTAYLKACHDAGILFVGGSTATVLFADETGTRGQLEDWATRDSAGNIVLHPNGAFSYYRGSIAQDQDVPFSWANGTLTVTLPLLVAYDIVAISW